MADLFGPNLAQLMAQGGQLGGFNDPSSLAALMGGGGMGGGGWPGWWGGGGSPQPAPTPAAPAPATPAAPTGSGQFQLPPGFTLHSSVDGQQYVLGPDGSTTYLGQIPTGAPTALTSNGMWQPPYPGIGDQTGALPGQANLFGGMGAPGIANVQQPQSQPQPIAIPTDFPQPLPANLQQPQYLSTDPNSVNYQRTA